MESMGDRVRLVRKELGLRQNEVARRVGFSQATLCELESNRSSGTKEAAKLAAVLGVSALWLADGNGEKHQSGAPVVVPHGVPENVVRLAEKLLLLPDEKLKALAVLVGIKF